MKKKDTKQKIYYGGQAVIEGVMMRGRKSCAVSVRKNATTIITEKTPISQTASKYPILKLPIFRGIAMFISSLVTGTKILNRSAELAWDAIEEETPEEEKTKFDLWLEEKFGDKLSDVMIYLSVLLALALGIGLFMVLPVFVGNLFKPLLEGSQFLLSLTEGLTRLGVFLLYMVIISRMKDVKRLFMYHGAEHKTINCYESGDELTVENVRRHTRMHKRCGTSFLLIVMVVSIVVFFFVPPLELWMRVLSRLALVPLVSGVAYEIIKWAGSADNVCVKIVSAPGMLLQRLSTAEPEDAMIETAIASLKAVLIDDGELPPEPEPEPEPENPDEPEDVPEDKPAEGGVSAEEKDPEEKELKEEKSKEESE
ncbi:MAG: DUF1385 domain-containing protein [Firmicutes bacterium]|nr:DUF1385 domain-containing protein [Bacillota bacterium]